MSTKLFVGIFAFLAMVACSNQDSIDQESSIGLVKKSQNTIRSYEEALAIAQASIPMLEESTTFTRSGDNIRKIDLKDRKVFKLDAKTRTNSDINDTLIYVFNFEDNAGFALVSASKNTEGLLAITEQGYCDPNVKSENEGFEMFKEMAKQYVLQSSPIVRTPSDPIVETKDSITYSFSTVGPYVTVKWGQTLPEGEFCSNGHAGCTNTAMAQIMSHFNQPTSINITYAGADVSYQTMNWTNMKAHATGHTLSSCSNANTHKTIGRLLRQLGELNGSQYYSNGETGTSTYYVAPSTFGGFQYTCGSWESYSSLIVRTNLNQGQLYLVYGYNYTFDGHTWVLDGYRTMTKTIRKMARTATSGWFFTGEENIIYTHYPHYNWGWYGNCDGYFLEGIYETTQGTVYDSSAHSGSYNFCYYVDFLNVYHN